MLSKLFKSKMFFQTIIASMAAVFATVGIVAATTTIGTSINTGGTLDVTSTTATSTFSTGGLTVGTNQFVVQQTSGKVGIGTTTLAATLNVQNYDTSNPLNLYDSSGRSVFTVNQFGNTVAIRRSENNLAASFNGYKDRSGAIVNNADEIVGLRAFPYDGTAYRQMASVVARIDGTPVSGTNVPIAWIFTTGQAISEIERMRISSAGLVGVGINAPTALLHISTTTPGVDVFKVTAGSNNFVYNKNGYLGIGTTTPLANLQVTTSTANATTSVQFGKANQNKGTCMTLYDTAGNPVYAYIATGASAFTLQNGGTAPSGCQN